MKAPEHFVHSCVLEALRHDLPDIAVDIHRLGGVVVGTGHASDRLLATPPGS